MVEPHAASTAPQPAVQSHQSRATLDRKPPQFSLRTLLIVVTLTAIALPLLQLLGWRYARFLAAVLLVQLPAISIATCAIYSRGPRQTFFLGAIAGSVLLWFNGLPALSYNEFADVFALAVAQLAICGLSGFVALATRRFVERRGWNRPAHGEENPPRL